MLYCTFFFTSKCLALVKKTFYQPLLKFLRVNVSIPIMGNIYSAENTNIFRDSARIFVAGFSNPGITFNVLIYKETFSLSQKM